MRKTRSSGGDGTARSDVPARARGLAPGDKSAFRPRFAPILVFVGPLAVQLAWIGSFQAFRGLDEHDHVYRADSVAAGHWVSSGETTDQSRGELISVRRSIIEAAGPVCDAWPYTEHYNCHAYAADGPDRALVASAAARYNPVFYWVIGTAARPFEGTSAVYAMRVAGAVICALLAALAFAALQQLTASTWRVAALLVVLTPMMTYSTAVAAPNGVEQAAALLTWASLLAIARRPVSSPRLPTWLTLLAATGLLVLSTVRLLGPFWALLIVAAVTALTPRSRLRSLLREHRRSLTTIGGAWLAAAMAGVIWSVANGTNDPSSERESLNGTAWDLLPRQLVLWALQSIGAFPARDQRAPVIVYALFVVASAVVLWLGIRGATRRTRRVMLAILVAVVVVSSTITVVTYPEVGLAWQGRYVWPLSMGVPLLAGLSITRTSGRTLWLLLVSTLVAAATAISQVRVLDRETGEDASSDNWTFLPASAIVALTLVGFALVLVADLYSRPPSRQHPTSDLA
ncbi:MAG: DUF2142 domain-containing protein [Actinomycetota bacterium]|nr:DUF2142 domain-containing protein [Actinomycetota bacterium]